jgi:septum formation protein
MTKDKKIILASRSPRRQALLRQIGIKFLVRESGIDEDEHEFASPMEHVLVLSWRKADAVRSKVGNALVIGADTIVVCDKKILGKPNDKNDAAAMLSLLSGRTHEVYTGFTILDAKSGRSISDYEVTKVTFRKLLRDEISAYVAGGSPLDKAGAYGIQDDYGAVFVERVDGCFYNVVGFPLTKFYMAMKKFGFAIIQPGKRLK